MKANELMIGDWVEPRQSMIPTTYCKVEGIYPDGTVHLDKTETLFTLDELTPVPLTPEILEKNGFVANKHVYPYPYYEYINEEGKLKVGFAFPQGNRTSYKEPWIYVDSEYVFVEHLPCIYVHQLQHALSLCRIKKEIVL